MVKKFAEPFFFESIALLALGGMISTWKKSCSVRFDLSLVVYCLWIWIFFLISLLLGWKKTNCQHFLENPKKIRF